MCSGPCQREGHAGHLEVPASSVATSPKCVTVSRIWALPSLKLQGSQCQGLRGPRYLQNLAFRMLEGLGCQLLESLIPPPQLMC